MNHLPANSTFLLLALLSTLSCDRFGTQTADESTDAAEAEPTPEVPFTLELGQPGVLYTWIDGEGRFSTTEDADEIPDENRSPVRVVVEGSPPGTESHVFVANLTGTSEGQTPTIVAMKRDAWEAFGLKYRQAVVGPLEKKAEARAAERAALPDGVEAIVYGAQWCKACHQAEEYLKKRGLTVVRRDIEKDPSARDEMQAKKQSAGLGGSSIPVLDVGGTILMGFSQRHLDAAIRKVEAARNQTDR